MSDVPLRPGELAQLIDTVPAANLRQFMRSVGFMSNDLTAALKLADLVALSERPAAMHLLTEAGSDVLQIVRRREAGDWARVEELAGDLERHHARFPAPDDWQRFLDRIKRGDTAALDEAAEPARIQRLAEARAAGTLEQYVRSQLVRGRPTLLRTVEEAAKSARAGLVEDLANMSARELDALPSVAGRSSTSSPRRSASVDPVTTISGWASPA